MDTCRTTSQAAHSTRATGSVSVTRLRPIGSVRKVRHSSPRRVTSAESQSGQRNDSRGCSIENHTSPST